MSILGDIVGALPVVGPIAKAISPILGGASTAADKSGMTEEQLALQRARLQNDQYQQNTVTNPAARLRTAKSASMISNFQPSTAEWGGPGSGLRGQTVNFKGAFANPDVYSTIKPQADDAIHQALTEQLLRGSDSPAIPNAPGGAGRSILGGASLGTSILGALSGLVKKKLPVLPSTNEPDLGIMGLPGGSSASFDGGDN